MDALYVLHTAQQHQQVFPELQSHWHQLTLGTSPWDHLKTITLALHPLQILFVPEAFSKLQNVTKLEILRKPLSSSLMPALTAFCKVLCTDIKPCTSS